MKEHSRECGDMKRRGIALIEDKGARDLEKEYGKRTPPPPSWLLSWYWPQTPPPQTTPSPKPPPSPKMSAYIQALPASQRRKTEREVKKVNGNRVL